jgi:iron complex transport system substrate-binding protein
VTVAGGSAGNNRTRRRGNHRVLTLALVIGCSGTAAIDRTVAARPCVGEVDPHVDYFPHKFTPEHAELMRITYHRTHAELTVLFPHGDGPPEMTSEERYLLLPCGIPRPASVASTMPVVSLPVQTVSVTHNEDLGMLVELGLLDGIVSVGTKAIYPQEVWDRFQSGRIRHAGGWGGEGPQVETLVDLEPDLILLGPYGGITGAHGMQLREVGLAALPTMIREEPTPLGRAEWIRLMGLLTGREVQADSLFAEVREEYRALQVLVRDVADPPSALWATTYAPGVWRVGRNSVQARLLEDAGARNVLADHGVRSTVEMSPEALLDRGADADVWITENTHMIRDGKLTVPDTRIDAMRAYRSGRFYHVSARYRQENSASDYYFSGPMRPDVVLRDLIAVLHPALLPSHTLHHLAPMERLR